MERHDEDWEKGTIDPWVWRDVDRRGENIINGSIFSQVPLKFLPGKTWKFKLKLTYENSSWKSKSTLISNGMIVYMQPKQGHRFIDYLFNFSHHLGLNHSNKETYSIYWYLGPKFHVAKNISIGTYLGMAQKHWRSYPDFVAKTSQTYEIKQSATELLIKLNLKI